MKIIILVLILNLFLPYAYAAYDFQSADCIGGYEDPNADGVCTECPEGKASGNYDWKVYNNQANECIDVPITCGPGQLLNSYSGGYFYCADAQQGFNTVLMVNVFMISDHQVTTVRIIVLLCTLIPEVMKY